MKKDCRNCKFCELGESRDWDKCLHPARTFQFTDSERSFAVGGCGAFGWHYVKAEPKPLYNFENQLPPMYIWMKK